jgi:hypothetical protein
MPDSWARFKTEHLRGQSLVGQGDFARAEPILLSGYQGLMRLNPTVAVSDRVAPPQMVAPIVLMYRSLGKPGEAAKWEQKGQ